MMYKNFLKRIFDFTIALIGLICLSPIFIIVTIGLYFANQGKPFFFQARPGLNGNIFKIIKFKSMNDKTNANGQLLPDADRLTPIGAFVRKTSLDEIPQLINVLKGDMSLIGPRPLLPEYIPYYTIEEAHRHNVRPGITGLAQMKGRNNIGWDKKLAYDVEYVKTLSFKNDVFILINTIKNVINRKDIVVIPGEKGMKLNAYRKDYFILRKFNEDDIQTRVDWLNNTAINSTMNLQLPIQFEKTLDWYNTNKENTSRIDLVLEQNGEIVAMTGFSNKINGKVDSYTFVNPYLKGKGIGTVCMFSKLVYGFELFGVEEIESIIDFDNIASRKMVEKVGFELAEVIENGLVKNNRSVDRCRYTCTKESFNSTLYRHKIVNNELLYVYK